MTDEEVLNRYRPLVSFISELCGPAAEVVLHNTKDPVNSVIAIENGYHSGRGIGSPLTDLAESFIKTGAYKENDYISNYNGSSKGHDYRSSTYFIKNEGKLVGMLCVNCDMSVSKELENVVARLKQQYNLTNVNHTELNENLDVPVNKMISTLISSSIKEFGVDPLRMKIVEKIEIVHKLKQKGVLSMKGAISETAEQLNVSVPTIYRYMNREEQE